MNLDLEGKQLVVTFDVENAAAHVYSRKVGERALLFETAADGTMQDQETGTLWDRTSGEAFEGELENQSLEQQVGFLAFANSWRAFHPTSREVQP